MDPVTLYLLRPIDGLDPDPWSPWYDKAFGFVIRAESEQAARTLADKKGGDETRQASPGYKFNEPRHPWLNPAQSSCETLSADGPEELVIQDFNSA